MEGNKKYSATDLARYHSGDMSPMEMHALEKAALDDPFLADALEGYAHSKNPDKELKEIRIQLEEKKNKNRVFGFPARSKNLWWKIAAIFILLAGVGYFFFFLKPQKINQLAINEDRAMAESTATVVSPPIDSAKTLSQPSVQKAQPKSNPKEASKGSTERQLTQVTSVKSKKEITTAKISGSGSKASEIPSAVTSVHDMNSTAVNRETSVVKHGQTQDPGDKSFFRSPDSVSGIVTTPGIQDENKNQKIESEKTAPSLKEITATGYGNKRKAGSDKALEGKVSGINVSDFSPKGGYASFNQYIKKNAKPAIDSSGKIIDADILLSFILDKRGRPEDVRVIRSNCKPCETEAIRLLKDGPKWIGKAGIKREVRIMF